tara:strand:- start:1412 stop:1717 length:306 start_codon:yes stop_codon:yes gene_type:complete
MSENVKKDTYYAKNKQKMKEYYIRNKEKIAQQYQEKKLLKSQYNKDYYHKIKKEQRQTLEYYNYQKNYYRLKKQGMRASDIIKKKVFIKKQIENKHIVNFD